MPYPNHGEPDPDEPLRTKLARWAWYAGYFLVANVVLWAMNGAPGLRR